MASKLVFYILGLLAGDGLGTNVPANARRLEDGTPRLLENGTYRILEA